MPDSIPANTACKPPESAPSAAGRAIRATCERIVREQIPNLLRLYLNPYVAQTCYCLTQLIESTWSYASAGNYQVFLANSMEEALSGAIKLARYSANLIGNSPGGVLLDGHDRLEHFASTELSGFGAIEYVPGLKTLANACQASQWLLGSSWRPGFVVAFLSSLQSLDEAAAETIRLLFSSPDRPLAIICADRNSIAGSGAPVTNWLRELIPDIVIFDESFVEHAVPFGAFAATKQLYRHWNKRGMATFHSTTFQPNAISSLHFMRCLPAVNRSIVERHATALNRIEDDLAYRNTVYRKLYSPSLAKLISTVNFGQKDLCASGHYVQTSNKQWFDAVGGVACSIRGHNPPRYVDELDQTGDIEDCRDEVAQRLHGLTGLPHVAPAVSGASAVEQALKIALASQFPRQYVLALRGGFGGKTMLALTATWKPSLKTGLAPLYPHVVYVDPFADDAIAALECACERFPIAVIQFELIQGVGGVRALPTPVLNCLSRLRKQYGCLLFADEIQTGFYRTGPFARSSELGIHPDLLTVGKGASDMMFPFAMTLHSAAVQETLDDRVCFLPQTFRSRYNYELGFLSVLGTLRRAEREHLSDEVRAKGEIFSRLLHESLTAPRLVRDVRCFGMLLGIELNVETTVRRWLKRLLPQCVLMALLNHRAFPLIAGYCQYEPHVLKLTPPLTITEDEIRNISAALSSVLQLPLQRLAAAGAWQATVRPLIERIRRNNQ